MKDYIKNIAVEQIISKYRELGNVWKVGDYFGIAGQTIYDELKERGVVKPRQTFTKKDERFLIDNYESYSRSGRLDELARQLGRTKQFICRKARTFGLTGRIKKYNFSDEKRKRLSELARERIRIYGHPRGALGLIHTEESKRKMGEASRRAWKEHYEEWHSEERRRQRSDAAMKMNERGAFGVRSNCYLWEVTVGNKTFLAKSSWEYDVALYLEYLKKNQLIDEWEYESERFVFEYNTLGVRSYKPDFVVKRGKLKTYIEVKGLEDDKYLIKRELVEKEYPDISIIYIREKQYRLLKKKYSKLIDGWGSMKEMAGKEIKHCSVIGCDNVVHSKGLCRHHYYEKFKK